MNLTWQQAPSDPALFGEWQPPLGYALTVDKEVIGAVRGVPGRRPETTGWYWVASSKDGKIPFLTTLATPVATAEQAKAECEDYIHGCLNPGNV